MQIPYAPRDIGQGFAFEDWQWNCETMTSGYVHRIAGDTIIFKRRRELSQTTQASGRRALIRDVEFQKIDVVGTFTGKSRDP